jgi:phage shock protein C
MKKRLTCSKTNKVIFGVCGGIAEYMDADASIVRLITAVGSIVFPVGFFCYLTAAMIMPQE